LSYDYPIEPSMIAIHLGYLTLMGVVGMLLTYPKFEERLSR